MSRRRALLIPLAILLGLAIRSLVQGRSIDTVTAAFLLGALAMLCLVGIGFGLWSARRAEKRRRARQDIFINH